MRSGKEEAKGMTTTRNHYHKPLQVTIPRPIKARRCRAQTMEVGHDVVRRVEGLEQEVAENSGYVDSQQLRLGGISKRLRRMDQRLAIHDSEVHDAKHELRGFRANRKTIRALELDQRLSDQECEVGCLAAELKHQMERTNTIIDTVNTGGAGANHSVAPLQDLLQEPAVREQLDASKMRTIVVQETRQQKSRLARLESNMRKALARIEELEDQNRYLSDQLGCLLPDDVVVSMESDNQDEDEIGENALLAADGGITGIQR
jgi:chromosome segregation ATPase